MPLGALEAVYVVGVAWSHLFPTKGRLGPCDATRTIRSPPIQLAPAGAGVYRGPGQVMMAGQWQATVTVTRGGQRLGSKQLPIVAR